MSVHVGLLRMTFHLPGARSLKDKRQIVRSFVDRVRGRMPVSVAEVGAQDLLQRAEIAVAVVSSSAVVCDEVMASVASMGSNVRDAVVVDTSTEVMTMGEGR
jgi:uncharacterized protein YlxP (DUF503 family)